MGLTEWFAALPKGLDAELQSGDGGLSAGEAQLLVFTRVFLKDPGLVILDEASSRLDPATEARIERAALAYIARHPDCAELDLRFDVILIARGRWPKHMPGAWRPRE